MNSRAVIVCLLLCVCASQGGRSMRVHRSAGVMNHHDIDDIDSLTFDTISGVMNVHGLDTVTDVNLVTVDSVTFGGQTAPYTMYPTGNRSYSIVRDNVKNMTLGNTCWGPSWAWFSFSGNAGIGPNGERLFIANRDIPNTTSNITLRHRAYAADPYTVVTEWVLTPDLDNSGAYIVAGFDPNLVSYGEGAVIGVMEDDSVAEYDPGLGRAVIGGQVFKRFYCVENDGDTVTITLDPPAQVSSDGDGRIRLAPTDMVGYTDYTTTITFTFPEPVNFIVDQDASYFVSDTGGWFPYETGPNGTPIDLSFLNKDGSGNWVEAGSHGFLQVVGEEFQFEDGTPVKFWGLNVTAGAAKPSDTRAAQIAERLARLGVNVVRLHHLDSWWTNSIIDKDNADGTTQHLDSANVAQLDRMVYELKSRGIYVVLDPWVGRQFAAGDSVPGWEDMEGNFGLHPYVYFDDHIQDLIKLQLKQIWTHVNPHTGLAYKDDPGIILTEVINEGLMQRGGNHVSLEPYRTDFMALYESWAAANGAETGIGDRIIRNNYGEDNLRFYIHVHEAFYNEMHDYFRDSIGLRIPINPNNWYMWTWELVPQARTGDFTDVHHYYGGDVIGAGSQLGDVWVKHRVDGRGTPWGKIAGAHLYGRPLTISECGQNTPKTYRAAYYPAYAAMACFQGWDGITGYAYTQSGSPGDDWRGQFNGAYEWERDPATIASIAAGSLIMRRGDVSPAQDTVVMQLPESEWWVLEWQNDGERQHLNLPEFNAMIEQHKTVVVLGDTIPSALSSAQVLTTDAAVNYVHPSSELRSDTDELWRDWDLGVGHINTPRTQAIYGMLGERDTTWATTDMTATIQTPFATLSLSSLTTDPIAQSDSLLLIAVSEAEATGTEYDYIRSEIEVQGDNPIICRPVVGTVTFTTAASALTAYPIMIDGSRGTGLPVSISGGTATLQLSASDQTLFYEIE